MIPNTIDNVVTSTSEDLTNIIDEPLNIWECKLRVTAIPTKTLDRVRAFKKFISEDLSGMDAGEWKIFAEDDVKKHFLLTLPQAKIKIAEVIKERKVFEKKEYDSDSFSGRALISRDIAAVFIKKQDAIDHPIKCISGKLMKYNNGIYEDSEEERSFMSKEIKDIGEDLIPAMPANLIDQTVRLIELDTLVRADECEPDTEHVIVLNNGILDLRTWKFRDFDPDEVYFSKIPVDYIPDAPKPTKFYNFVDTCFKGNEDQKDLLQESFGYALTKTYKYQDIFYWLGDGGNGKGSMLQVLMEILGVENYTSFSLLQLTDGEHVDYKVPLQK